MPAQGGAGQQSFDQMSSVVFRVLGHGGLNLGKGPPQGPAILVQKNRRRPLGTGFGQGYSGRPGDGVVFLALDPFLPGDQPAACGDQCMLDGRHGRLAAVTMHLDGFRRQAAHDDLLALHGPEVCHAQPRARDQRHRAAATAMHLGGHRLQGSRSFHADRGHRASPRRRELDNPNDTIVDRHACLHRKDL